MDLALSAGTLILFSVSGLRTHVTLKTEEKVDPLILVKSSQKAQSLPGNCTNSQTPPVFILSTLKNDGIRELDSYLRKSFCHLKCSNCIHVGTDDGYNVIWKCLLSKLKFERPGKIHLTDAHVRNIEKSFKCFSQENYCTI